MNELGGFDFRDRESNELVPNFQDYTSNFNDNDKNAAFAEVIDFLLHTRKPQCVSLAFAAASSDLFKEDMNTVKNNSVDFRKLKQEVQQLVQKSKAFGQKEIKMVDEEEEIPQFKEM